MPRSFSKRARRFLMNRVWRKGDSHVDFHHFVSALPVVQVRIFFRQKMSRRLVVGSLVLFSRKKEACCNVMLQHASFLAP